MKVALRFEEINRAMTVIMNTVSDKSIQESFKNVIIWRTNNQTYFVAHTVYVTSAVAVESEVQVPNEEWMIQLSAKEVTNILAALRSSKQSTVQQIIFEQEEQSVILTAKETIQPLEKTDQPLATTESCFRLPLLPIKQITVKALSTFSLNVEGQSVETNELQTYLDALCPIVALEKRANLSTIYFSADHVYAMLPVYVVLFQNRLPSLFDNFRLTSSNASFLRTMLQGQTVMQVNRITVQEGVIVLQLQTDEVVAEMRCMTLVKNYPIELVLETPETFVQLDKRFILDVIKRMSLYPEDNYLAIRFQDHQATCEILSPSFRQPIPVITSQGAGNFQLSIRPEILKNFILGHVKELEDTVILAISQEKNGIVSLMAQDEHQYWFTKINGISNQKGQKTAWKR